MNGTAVSGVFAEARGQDGPGSAPPFSCVFLLRGTLTGDRAAVETWFPGAPERIGGDLVFKPDGADLKLQEDHGGCPMTTGSMVGQPLGLSRDEEGTGWLGVGLVTAKRAVLRATPEGPMPRAPYIVEHDPVVILERRDRWVRASYRGGSRPISGWLATSDLVLVAP